VPHYLNSNMTHVVEIKSKKLLGPGYVSFVLVDDLRLYPRLAVYAIKTLGLPTKIALEKVLREGNLLPDCVAIFHYPIIPDLRLKLAKAERLARRLKSIEPNARFSRTPNSPAA